jgi:hypothetical protein
MAWKGYSSCVFVCFAAFVCRQQTRNIQVCWIVVTAKRPRSTKKPLTVSFVFWRKKIGSNHTRKSCDGAKRVHFVRKRDIHDINTSCGSPKRWKWGFGSNAESVEIFAFTNSKELIRQYWWGGTFKKPQGCGGRIGTGLRPLPRAMAYEHGLSFPKFAERCGTRVIRRSPLPWGLDRVPPKPPAKVKSSTPMTTQMSKNILICSHWVAIAISRFVTLTPSNPNYRNPRNPNTNSLINLHTNEISNYLIH